MLEQAVAEAAVAEVCPAAAQSLWAQIIASRSCDKTLRPALPEFRIADKASLSTLDHSLFFRVLSSSVKHGLAIPLQTQKMRVGADASIRKDNESQCVARACVARACRTQDLTARIVFIRDRVGLMRLRHWARQVDSSLRNQELLTPGAQTSCLQTLREERSALMSPKQHRRMSADRRSALAA